MEIHPLLTQLISSGLVVIALAIALSLFAALLALLTTEIFGRLLE